MCLIFVKYILEHARQHIILQSMTHDVLTRATIEVLKCRVGYGVVSFFFEAIFAVARGHSCE